MPPSYLNMQAPRLPHRRLAAVVASVLSVSQLFLLASAGLSAIPPQLPLAYLPAASPEDYSASSMTSVGSGMEKDLVASQHGAGDGVSESQQSGSSFDETARPERLTAMDSESVKFTPESLLSAPRRSGLQPNADATHGLYTVSTYSFEKHAKTKEIRLFDMQTGRSTLITDSDKASEPHWLENEILYLQEGSEKGTTELLVASISGSPRTYTAAVVPGSISDLKLKTIEPGKVAVACAAKTTLEGKMWNSETEVKRKHTGVVYESTFVRHWDSYADTTHNALWYGLFTLSESQSTGIRGQYALSPLVNVLAGTKLESPPPPFGGTDSFDIGKGGLVFVAKDPELNPGFHTKCNFYHVAISDFTSQATSAPRLIQADGLEGAATAPAISPDGKMAVYLQMKKDGYEADKNRVVVVQDLFKDEPPFELYHTSDGKGAWDKSPSKAVWGPNGRDLYLIAGHEGKDVVFDASVDAVSRNAPPRMLTRTGSTGDVTVLAADKLLLSGSSLVDNSVWSLLELPRAATPEIISSNSNNGAAFGLSKSQVSEMWFDGSNGRRVQAWVLRPSKPAKGKLPLAMFVHGGPQGAWTDAWSTRWNPAVFAEQGYVVVAPNPTGSTSFGQAFTDAINQNWGGAPYEDIVACFEHVKRTMGDEVDLDRAVALGGSYGGYMMNWINGHDLGREFKALVCHDGVFSTSFSIAQDEIYFPVHDLGGFPWEVPKNWAEWDPARFTGNWETPELIIHSEKDYRLAMSEGIAAFNVLQARGVDSRLLYFPDENHWVLKEENSRVWHTVVLNWINKYAGLPQFADEDKVVGPAVGRSYKKAP